MTPADVAKVLAKIAAFDQRTVGQSDIAAWHEILAPHPLGEALQAVTRHHRDSVERIKPAHVVARIKEIRTEQTRNTAEPLARPSRFEPDVVRDVRLERGLATCRDVVGPIAERLAQARRANEVAPTDSEVIRERAIRRATDEHRERRRSA